MPETEPATIGLIVHNWLCRLEQELERKRLFAVELKRLEQSAYTIGELEYSRHAIGCIKWVKGRIPRKWFKAQTGELLTRLQTLAASSPRAVPLPEVSPDIMDCLTEAEADELLELALIVIGNREIVHGESRGCDDNQTSNSGGS